MDESRQSKVSSWLKPLLTLRIEIICVIIPYCALSRLLAYQQLVQDKICLQNHQMPVDYCKILSTAEESEIKNEILSDTTIFLTKKELIILIPNLISGFYAGSWCDLFKHGRRIVCVLGIFGYFLESSLMGLNGYFFDLPVNYLLLVSLPLSFIGNGFWIAVLSYLTISSKQKDRPLKFLILDVVAYGGGAMGFLLGSWLLSNPNPLFRTPLRNYVDNFGSGSLLLLVTMFYVMFIPFVDKSEETDKKFKSESKESTSTSSSNTSHQKSHLLIRIFTLRHLKDTVMSVFVKRPLNFHKTVWWVIVFLTLQTLPILGAMNILFPLTERLYKWDYVTYSKFAMLSQLVRPIAITLAMPVLLKLLKLNEVQVSMTGTIFNILSCNALASIVTPIGFYMFVGFGSLASIGSIGVRAFFTRFIPEDEISKVFSVLMTLEILQPFVGSFFYSSILRATIKDYPTFGHHLSTGFLIFALCIICLVDNKWADVIRKQEEEKAKRKSLGSIMFNESDANGNQHQ